MKIDEERAAREEPRDRTVTQEEVRHREEARRARAIVRILDEIETIEAELARVRAREEDRKASALALSDLTTRRAKPEVGQILAAARAAAPEPKPKPKPKPKAKKAQSKEAEPESWRTVNETRLLELRGRRRTLRAAMDRSRRRGLAWEHAAQSLLAFVPFGDLDAADALIRGGGSS